MFANVPIIVPLARIRNHSPHPVCSYRKETFMIHGSMDMEYRMGVYRSGEHHHIAYIFLTDIHICLLCCAYCISCQVSRNSRRSRSRTPTLTLEKKRFCFCCFKKIPVCSLHMYFVFHFSFCSPVGVRVRALVTTRSTSHKEGEREIYSI
jgi:hypothetical protein